MIRQHKGKLSVHSQEEEDDQRIGEGHNKGRPGVIPEGTLLLTRLVHILRWIRTIGVKAEAEQHDTTHNLKVETILVVGDEVHDERHTETSDSCIDNIAYCSTDTCGQTIPAAFIQRTLHTKYTNGSHRCTGNYPDHHPLEDEIYYVNWYNKHLFLFYPTLRLIIVRSSLGSAPLRCCCTASLSDSTTSLAFA